MTIKERELLFKLNDQVKKLTSPPLSTFTSMTGQVTPTPPYQPGTTPLPLLGQNQTQGYNPPVK